jgi:acetyl-CoA carboxylase biotin carboxylase subunit
MVAKLICWAEKREVAIERMKRALDEYVIEGIKTNIPFLKRVLAHPGFIAGKYDTRIVDQILAGNVAE